MTENKVISFRASGRFLELLKSQQINEESESQAAQRLLKSLLMGQNVEVSTMSTAVSTNLSTIGSENATSTTVSTKLMDTVDKLTADNELLLKRMDKLEKQLEELPGKLSA